MKKMNYSKLLTIVLSCLLLGTTSCTDDLDINSDPLSATTVEPRLLFPTVMVSVSSNRTVELNSVNIQAQHWASGGSAGVFRNPEVYVISPNTTNNVWVGQYSTALRNLQQMRALTAENNPDASNIIGQVKIYEAFVFLNLTQLYEDIPFSEATQVGEFPNPKFDSQEDVLRGIVTRLNEGIELLNAETDIITNGDLIYQGDRELWIRFANSLKLKTLMLIANVDPSSVQEQLQEVSTQPLILENSQNAYLSFSDAGGNENPLWKTLDNFAGGTNPFWYAGSTLVNLMNSNDDPRRATFFDEEEGGVYKGQDQGVFSSAGISHVSLNILRPDLEDRYATASETYFFLAEAAIKGWITGDADEYYQKGVEASLNSYNGQPGEISQTEKDAYLAGSRGSIAGLSDEEAIQQINEEQYVSLFTQGIEAFTHWRRTKTPQFMQPVDAALTDIIRRYPYPNSEISSNPNAPSVPALDKPMWFEN
jgi:hypothetical protein